MRKEIRWAAEKKKKNPFYDAALRQGPPAGRQPKDSSIKPGLYHPGQEKAQEENSTPK